MTMTDEETRTIEQLATMAEDFDAGAITEMTSGVLMEGYTYGDFADITTEELESAYTSGFNLINQGKAEQAEKLFRFLLMLDHHDERFWMGLGVSLQIQQKYRMANDAYTYLWIRDYSNCIPALRSAECLMAIREFALAEGAAAGAEAAAARQPEKFAAELARARLILSEIEAEKANLE